MASVGEFEDFFSFAVNNSDEAVPFFGDFSEVGLSFGIGMVVDEVDCAEEIKVGIADESIDAEFEPVQRFIDVDDDIDG